LWFLRAAVGEFAGKCGTRDDLLPHDLFCSREPQLRFRDRQFRDLVTCLRVLVEPQGEAVLDHATDERSRFARGKSLLRLPRELRVLEFRAEDEVESVPDVFG